MKTNKENNKTNIIKQVIENIKLYFQNGTKTKKQWERIKKLKEDLNKYEIFSLDFKIWDEVFIVNKWTASVPYKIISFAQQWDEVVCIMKDKKWNSIVKNKTNLYKLIK